MKIHILSDLHTEFAPHMPSEVAQDVDLVILAGDIGTKGRGVEFARGTYKSHVIYVPGNHEYFREHCETMLEKMRAESCDRVRVLDNEQWIFGGVRFLGSTCWTDYSSTGNAILAKYEAQKGLNDYQKIRTAGYRKLRPDDLVLRNALALAWLQDRLAERFDGSTVVVSHHAPSLISMGHAPFKISLAVPNASSVAACAAELDRWRIMMGDSSKTGSTHLKPSCPVPTDFEADDEFTEEDPIEVPHIAAAYANNWEFLMGKPVLWVHGHVHRKADYMIGSTRVICNPKGYPGENTGFDAGLVVEI